MASASLLLVGMALDRAGYSAAGFQVGFTPMLAMITAGTIAYLWLGRRPRSRAST
jgi:hypothetical protein